MKKLLIIAALLWPSFAFAADKQPLSRTLIAFYDTREESSPRTSQIHRFLEMPANHLGYDIAYYDINEPLPELTNDVAGVVLWFNVGVEVPDANAYLNWLTKAADKHKKILLVENTGLGDKSRQNSELMKRWNALLEHIGIRDNNSWNDITYNASISYADPSMMNFEREVGPTLPALPEVHAISGAGTVSHLTAHQVDGNTENTYDLVITGPEGGYIAQGYALYHVPDPEHSDVSQWYLNPFLFLKESLNIPFAPVPDATTLDGRRIFYAHIDGDGWNNVSEIASYDATSTISAEVIEKEILGPYHDFVFNVGLITGDVDKDCYGGDQSERVARDIFALPNVEPSSHTYTHPLFWQFFAHYVPQDELPMLNRYPPQPKTNLSLVSSIQGVAGNKDWSPAAMAKAPAPLEPTVKRGRNEESVAEILKKYFYIPRSYACGPFDIDKEIAGSLKRVAELSPPGKKPRLVQWPGDTSPFEAAIAKTREADALNINGGDSRFDAEYPSYSSVAPVGLKVGTERQIYSSNSNEDTYTNLWTDRFFGFKYLKSTVENTESPMRVRPFNVYFHIFSGQKDASLAAIKENLNYARSQHVIPLSASEYSDIARGFYSTRIVPDGKLHWIIVNRGALQTVRFDDGDKYSVDLDHSLGIIGYRYYQGSLYISLDPMVKESAIQLTQNKDQTSIPMPATPILIESRWKIKDLHMIKKTLTFVAQGYGKGRMTWSAPSGQVYQVKVVRGNDVLFDAPATADVDNMLALELGDVNAIEPVTVTFAPK